MATQLTEPAEPAEPAKAEAEAKAKASKRRKRGTPAAAIYVERNGASRLKSFVMFAAIPLFVFVVVVLIPFLSGVFLSFTNWNGIDKITSFDYEVTGVENYDAALSDATFRETMTRTFIYVIAVVILANVIAFLLALLVTSKLRARNFFRAVFFTPNLIGGVVLGFIWVFVFSQLIPYLGEKTGIGALEFSWLVDQDKAFSALIIVAVWQISGYLMLIYIAGIVSIPTDVIEAARVDGATEFKQLIFVKIPLMIPAFTVSVFLALRNAFLVFDVNLALTEGGPFRSTELVTLHVYNEAFRFQNFQTAQAKAIVLFVIVVIVAVTQVFFSKRFEVSE